MAKPKLTWTGLDPANEDDAARMLPADTDRSLAEEAFRAVRTWTMRDQAVFVDFPQQDTSAYQKLVAAFCPPGRDFAPQRLKPFQLGERLWWEIFFPARFYPAAREISLEQEAARKAA